jgi:L-glyceraldehyde 3-phosphate reductase
VTHFDLANNYGVPPGSAEELLGALIKKDFAQHRDELFIATKAGWPMWPGPYGGPGGSRKYLVASLDQSLRRLGLEYVDVFYSHRADGSTPLEETMGALAHVHRQGKALYVGISSYSPQMTRKAAEILRGEGVPLFVHQVNYSMLNRWIEGSLLQPLDSLGAGCVAFSPLAQGMLSEKYLRGIPEGARVQRNKTLRPEMLSPSNLERIRSLNEIALRRGQSLAQMAIAWVLRDPRVTCALVGARTVGQLDDTLDALKCTEFSPQELQEIDAHARDGGVDLWKVSSEIVC